MAMFAATLTGIERRPPGERMLRLQPLVDEPSITDETFLYKVDLSNVLASIRAFDPEHAVTDDLDVLERFMGWHVEVQVNENDGELVALHQHKPEPLPELSAKERSALEAREFRLDRLSKRAQADIQMKLAEVADQMRWQLDLASAINGIGPGAMFAFLLRELADDVEKNGV